MILVIVFSLISWDQIVDVLSNTNVSWENYRQLVDPTARAGEGYSLLNPFDAGKIRTSASATRS